MSRLFDIGSHIAKPPPLAPEGGSDGGESSSDSEASTCDSDAKNRDKQQPSFVPDGVGGGFDPNHVEELEGWIDAMTDDLPELRSFILPAGTVASAQLHVARCVCRRAERVVVELVEDGVCDPNAVRYLNRLSDFLFVAARWISERQGGDEILYKKPSKTSTQRIAMRDGN
jgi:cob(I)alamin adenosyltransferase